MKDFTTQLLNVRTVKPETIGVGSLLVAEPSLNDRYFKRAVVTLVDYSPDSGALGLVLNHPTGHTLEEFVDGVLPGTNIQVYCGGPVGDDRMVVVHTLGGGIFPGAKELYGGLYIGGDFDAAIEYINHGGAVDGAIRFFIGYSGWGATQLQDEIDEGTWAVTSAPPFCSSMLMGDSDAYWHSTVRRMGEVYRPWRLYPGNVKAN